MRRMQIRFELIAAFRLTIDIFLRITTHFPLKKSTRHTPFQAHRNGKNYTFSSTFIVMELRVLIPSQPATHRGEAPPRRCPRESAVRRSFRRRCRRRRPSTGELMIECCSRHSFHDFAPANQLPTSSQRFPFGNSPILSFSSCSNLMRILYAHYAHIVK